jgi:stage II sporulation protein D
MFALCFVLVGIPVTYAAEVGPAGDIQSEGKPVLLRVLLSAHLPRLTVGCDTAITISEPDGKTFGKLIPPVTVAIGAARITASDVSGSFSGMELELVPQQNGLLRFQDIGYRGTMRVHVSSRGGVLLLNVVELEDYLRGVVPAEVPALWPTEAVKAQAVAARTYAIQRASIRKNTPYDVTADVSDQVYLGVAKEHQASDVAIAETAGLIITYNSDPIVAYYHACSGGHTRDGPQPYLVGVESPENSPYDAWQLEYTLEELSAILDKGGFAVGSLLDVQTIPAAEVRDGFRVVFAGSRARVELTPSQTRSLLGVDALRSPRFRIELIGGEAEGLAELQHWMRTTLASAGDKTEVKVRGCVVTNGRKARRLTGTHYVLARVQQVEKVRFAGGGYGHGLGMSQYGAKYMAEQGATWREIIHHYYSGAKISDLSEIGRMPGF